MNRNKKQNFEKLIKKIIKDTKEGVEIDIEVMSKKCVSISNKLSWKLFKTKEIKEAILFARTGIAVHLGGKASDYFSEKTSNHVKKVFENKQFAHLFGPTPKALTKAAVSIGCKPSWIQHPENPWRMHFDITGKILDKAIEKCKT